MIGYEVMIKKTSSYARLKYLFGIWQDFSKMVGNVYSINDDYTIHVEGDFERMHYKSATKWILSASDENNHQQEDTVIQRMDRDKDTYNFIKYWAKSINGNYLDELERELIIRKWLLNQKHECICRECYISRRTYFRKVKEAERILILLWKLDHYDEYGNMRQYQEIFQERYEALGERAKIDEYYPAFL